MVQKVRYRGNPTSVSVLDSLLRDEGLHVAHREIVEQPGLQQDLVDVVLYVDDPDVNDSLGTSSEALITSKIATAIANLRTIVPRAQAQLVITRDREPHTSPPT